MSEPPIRRITPCIRRLYVKCFRTPEKITEAGIVLHARGTEREMGSGVRALIIAVGKRCQQPFAPGQFIQIARYSGTPVGQFDDIETAHVLINEDAVMFWDDRGTVMSELGLTEPDVTRIVDQCSRVDEILETTAAL